MNRLNTRWLRPHGLPENHIAALYALYARYYDGADATLFARDLHDKDLVLLLEDETGALRGFSTVKILLSRHQGQVIRALFSGDTIIDHRYWGEQTLPLAWCRLAGRIYAQAPDNPLYWLLIVKGDRTYRYLPVFSKQHYPSRRQSTPPAVQALMHQLATERFGTAYHAGSGVVRYPRSQGHLKPEWHSGQSGDHPEAAFFRHRNPGYCHGDELVCLTRLAPDNLRSFALRGFLQGMAEGPLPATDGAAPVSSLLR